MKTRPSLILLLAATALWGELLAPTSSLEVSTEAELVAGIASAATLDLVADIYLTSTVKIASVTGLVINGHGFKVDGQNNVRCFSIVGHSGDPTEVTFNNLAIAHGSCNVAKGQSCDFGGGFLVELARLTMNACNLTDNFASYYGGGIFICSHSNVTLSGCTATGNVVGELGGGFAVETSSTLTLIQSTTTGNAVSCSGSCFGGGLYADSSSVVVMKGCLTAGNTASPTSDAGDLNMVPGSNLTVQSACAAGEYYSGNTSATIECVGCDAEYPSDLLSGSCKVCPEGTFSCTGSLTACTANLSDNSCEGRKRQRAKAQFRVETRYHER